ncbi:uncharacterized protein LOC135554868 [Oncorhynchus masou masou]|uniref:uncharacterized protein LOC135554868 n=1 Tax=Oncorhynchus masou masou TaxID=90313 RepID=UPI00318358E6
MHKIATTLTLAHGNSSSSIEPLLSGTKAASFSGRLSSSSSASTVFAPGLRKYPQEGALSSLTASSSQAKALLASLSASSLSASSLSAEALLLSSTFRQHRLLREQQRASSLPNGRSSNSTTTSTTTSSSSTSSTSTTSSSPSSPTALTSLNLSSVGLKPSGRSLQHSGSNSYKDRGSKTLLKPVSPSNSQ